MADRVLFISWGTVVRGREARALEVFEEVLGFYGRAQQEGRIEGFDVVLLEPSSKLRGYVTLHGSVEQLSSLRQDDEFRRLIVDGELVVEDFSMVDGSANEGIAREMATYQAEVAKVPQHA